MLLNLDAGEHDDEPSALWVLADILAVACGGHAGDYKSMTRICKVITNSWPRIGLGVHPSYPDRENFGRQSMVVEPSYLQLSVESQCRQLAGIASNFGLSVVYVKPHGALYHDANRDRALADRVIAAALFGVRDAEAEASDPRAYAAAREAYDADLPTPSSPHPDRPLTIIGPPTGALADAAKARGLPYLREGFADRATRPDGSLVPRGEPGALITDPAIAAARARELVGQVDTVCVHADSPSSLQIARAVREVLGRRGGPAT